MARRCKQVEGTFTLLWHNSSLEAEWEGEFYPQKEVTVYYKRTEEGIVLLTVKARLWRINVEAPIL